MAPIRSQEELSLVRSSEGQAFPRSLLSEAHAVVTTRAKTLNAGAVRQDHVDGTSYFFIPISPSFLTLDFFRFRTCSCFGAMATVGRVLRSAARGRRIGLVSRSSCDGVVGAPRCFAAGAFRSFSTEGASLRKVRTPPSLKSRRS